VEAPLWAVQRPDMELPWFEISFEFGLETEPDLEIPKQATRRTQCKPLRTPRCLSI
jgi:hypothetical protein